MTTLADAPSIPRQPHCSLPWCGRTGKIDMHHVIPRSQGGHDGPQLPICHECHMQHHSDSGFRLAFIYTSPVSDPSNYGWFATRRNGAAGWLRVYDEACDVVPFDDPLPDDTVFHDALAIQRHTDWLLSREVLNLSRSYNGAYADFRDFIIESCDLSPKSAGAWIKNRCDYGALEGHGVEHIGITRGVQVARLVSNGHDLATVMRDLRTMPREQFDSAYPTTGGTR